MHSCISSLHVIAFGMLVLIAGEVRGEISIHTNFEGGSAKVASIDQKARIIRFKPGGDVARGWPCWWYFRAEGLPVGEDVTFEVMASEQPLLTHDKRKGKRIGLVVTGPESAFISADGTAWTQTPVGEKKPAGAAQPDVMSYRIKATTSTLWLAWGPPFLPKDTAALAEKHASIWKHFIDIARDEFQGAIPFTPITRFDGPDYSRFWQRISKNWVHTHAAPDALKLTLETVNNIRAATIDGYRETGADLGLSISRYMQQQIETP